MTWRHLQDADEVHTRRGEATLTCEVSGSGADKVRIDDWPGLDDRGIWIAEDEGDFIVIPAG